MGMGYERTGHPSDFRQHLCVLGVRSLPRLPKMSCETLSQLGELSIGLFPVFPELSLKGTPHIVKASVRSLQRLPELFVSTLPRLSEPIVRAFSQFSTLGVRSLPSIRMLAVRLLSSSIEYSFQSS